MSFLRAEWRKLALANYEVDPAILADFIPHKTELDIWNGICYVSLVGFMFRNTRLRGIKIPFHVDFEEVNLRFYVKYKEAGEWKRGVVFIKEIVPKPALTLVANVVYKEHYQTLPMRHLWQNNADHQIVEYKWKTGGKWQSFRIESELESIPIEKESETEFITEHFWGYTKITDQKTFEYEVTHPTWEVYPVRNYEVNVDFAKVYGPRFEELTSSKPLSVMLAEGSEITVENKRAI